MSECRKDSIPPNLADAIKILPSSNFTKDPFEYKLSPTTQNATCCIRSGMTLFAFMLVPMCLRSFIISHNQKVVNKENRIEIIRIPRKPNTTKRRRANRARLGYFLHQALRHQRKQKACARLTNANLWPIPSDAGRRRFVIACALAC